MGELTTMRRSIAEDNTSRIEEIDEGQEGGTRMPRVTDALTYFSVHDRTTGARNAEMESLRGADNCRSRVEEAKYMD